MRRKLLKHKGLGVIGTGGGLVAPIYNVLRFRPPRGLRGVGAQGEGREGIGCDSEPISAKVSSEASKPHIQGETPQVRVEAGDITPQLGDAQGPLDVMTREVVGEREVVLAQASQVEVLDP